MKFKTSFCHPLKKDIVELGLINKADVIDQFRSYDWRSFLMEMKLLSDKEIFYSPSFTMETEDGERGFGICAIECDEKGVLFLVIYRRPKLIIKHYGFLNRKTKEVFRQKHVTDIHDLYQDAAINYLSLFIEGKYDELEKDFS